MASSKKAANLKLSPKETRLLAAMPRVGSWVKSDDLKVKEYGERRSKWPPNARVIVTTTMVKLQQKLAASDDPRRLERTGGGRGGVSYRLVMKR